MNSKSIKFTEVKDKRLLKATPMEREKLIFVDNSYNVYYVGGVGESLQRNCRVRLRYLSGWFESFALKNIQASFNNEVTNVNACTKHKPNFLLREFTSYMNKFEVVSLFRSSRKYIYQTCSCLYILYRHCLLNISFRLVMFTIGF